MLPLKMWSVIGYVFAIDLFVFDINCVVIVFNLFFWTVNGGTIVYVSSVLWKLVGGSTWVWRRVMIWTKSWNVNVGIIYNLWMINIISYYLIHYALIKYFVSKLYCLLDWCLRSNLRLRIFYLFRQELKLTHFLSNYALRT